MNTVRLPSSQLAHTLHGRKPPIVATQMVTLSRVVCCSAAAGEAAGRRGLASGLATIMQIARLNAAFCGRPSSSQEAPSCASQ